MILVIIKFGEFLLRFSPRIINGLRSYIKHSKRVFHSSSKEVSVWSLTNQRAGFRPRDQNGPIRSDTSFLLIRFPDTSQVGEQGWRCGESTRLPPMWPEFDSRTRRLMWVEFVFGSRLCF